MGDVGALSAYLDRNQLSKKMLYLAFLSTLVIYYVMYMACYQFWTLMAFNNNFSKSLNDAYFFYINTIELLSFLFIRTRSSLKYLPKYLTIGNIMFLMYLNSYMYPAQFEALSLLQNFSLYLFMYFLNNFECEAINNWNPFGHWTPSEQNPRCGYHHMILSSHYNIGFDIFTMAYPLRFREFFSAQSQQARDLLSQEFNYGINFDPRPARFMPQQPPIVQPPAPVAPPQPAGEQEELLNEEEDLENGGNQDSQNSSGVELINLL